MASRPVLRHTAPLLRRSLTTHSARFPALSRNSAAALSNHVRIPAAYFTFPGPREIHSTSRQFAGMMPDTENPEPKESEAHNLSNEAAPLTMDEFHVVADHYLDELVNRLEDMQESTEGLELDYAQGVLNLDIPNTGTYVINKQPPNRQIWLSSPTSGPKRFDWVVQGDGMHEKEGSGSGEWIYLRDGTSLTELLRKEIGVDLHATLHEPKEAEYKGSE